MNEGDALLAMIRQRVRQMVPPEHQEVVTQIVTATVVTIMSEPQFFNRLTPVMELQHENALLRQHLAQAQAMLNRMAPARPRKMPTPRKAAPKKIVQKAPAVRVKPRTRRPKI